MSRRVDLPIDDVLADVQHALTGDEPAPLLLHAPPGSGKTTRVPAALLDVVPADQQIVVLEPRRLAARAAANRVASELATKVGEVVGYQVRGDTRTSKATRIRFVTEGVLVRQLVRDPFLDGVGAVCLDEFHERNLEGDLALAMLAEARSTVRPDLRLVVMSATLATEPLRQFLPGAGSIAADGRLHPVELVHLGGARDRPLEKRVRDGVERALDATAGDVLVFLAGVGEIRRSADELEHFARHRGVDVLPLHGRLDPRDQDRAIRPGDTRRVVLSTNVAESSLTIPGVTAVVDSGEQRELRFDRGRGVDVLELGRISRASAEQRAGRAGRTGPGICFRLWSAADERAMAAHGLPDVRRVDLAGPALLVRAFAGRDPAAFGWFEAPDAGALANADELLRGLGALTGDRLTPLGERLLELPVHPRLAAVVLAGQAAGGEVATLAATAATLLSDVDGLGRGDEGADLEVAASAFLAAEERGFPAALCREFASSPGAARALRVTRDRLLGSRRGRGGGRGERSGRATSARDSSLAHCLLAGFPDRVALRSTTAQDARHATMVGGRGLQLPPAMDGHELVIALRLLETGRQQRSRVVLAAAIERDELPALAEEVIAELDETAGRVFAVRQLRYRDLPLRSARGGELPPGAAAERLAPVLAADPWRWLGDKKRTADLRRLLARVGWLAERMPELELPPVDDEFVGTTAAELLGDRTSLRELDPDMIARHLEARLTPPQQRALRTAAPDKIALPSGRAAKVDYSAAAGPTIAARLQEFFGLRAVDALAGGRVPVVLELLAPNHRAVQVTTDLPSFWQNIYPQIRRELSRRYPRHSWPEDPIAARAEARPPRRPRR
ncbi:MAG: ATP-dependent helicase HrpB [bacterium]|nr:ATP-dependent helicase HrpB [bacterium]